MGTHSRRLKSSKLPESPNCSVSHLRSKNSRFETKIYHPNVNRDDGTLCEELLGKNWSPETQLNKCLTIGMDGIFVFVRDVLFMAAPDSVYGILEKPDGDNPVDEGESCDVFVQRVLFSSCDAYRNHQAVQGEECRLREDRQGVDQEVR